MRLLPLLAFALFLPFSNAEAENPGPFESFRDCDVCPEVVVLPAGRYVMGTPGRKFEQPAHEVEVPKSFAIGRYEVLFDEWDACHAAGGCKHNPDDHKWGRGNRPAINITVADVEQYLEWISAKTGKIYRLPTEAEWEYAARAGTETGYWWGDEVGKNRANCRECGSKWSGKGSAPAGSFKPNPWGLHDMHGNIWEWMQDCWNKTHDGAPTQATTPRQDGDCKSRVIRSGSWYYFPKLSRSSYRFKNNKRVKSYNIGFRVVRELE